MSNEFKQMEREDVVSVYSSQILVNHRTFTVNEFISAMMSFIRDKGGGLTEDKEKWFGEGLDCKILKPGAKRWQIGKVRIALEFIPEELEVAENSENNESPANKANSPLDDIRQMLPKNS